jgi:glycerol-3-phosphate dehydrogenase (NAD(P)+)
MSNDINQVIAGADIIVLAVPSVYFKATIEPLNIDISGKFFVSAIKGIVPGEYLTIAEFMNRRYGLSFEQMGVVTGPCHAEAVALERLSYLTIFCKTHENCVELGNRFKTTYINVSYNNDIYGAEHAPVLKNVYALAVGIVVGLGYGDNFIAVLISNSAMEMTRFMTQSYPAGRDMNASAYLGDLLVTAYSKFSRNRTFGVMIGKGYSVSSAKIEMNMVAEGYYATECLHHINRRHDVSMPILDAVYKILYKGENAEKTMKNLIKKLR